MLWSSMEIKTQKSVEKTNLSNNELTILFIDGDKKTRETYVPFLEKRFKTVYVANDAETAYVIYKEKKPNVLILEIDLPTLTGLQLLEMIRHSDISTKAIILTENIQTDVLIKASELKLSKYLLKPVLRRELLDALEKVRVEMESFEITCNKILLLKNDYLWNFETHTLKHHEDVIKLTKIEEKILNKLFGKKELTVSYDELLIDIWNSYDSTKIDLVKTSIKKLRKKLPLNTIQNIYGQGYKVI